MLKVLELVTTRDDISITRFHYHWRVVHAPLVLNMGMRTYIQSHEIDRHVWGFNTCDYPGIVEVWMEDLETIRAALTDPSYLDCAKPDEPNFANLDTSVVCIATDHDLKIAGPSDYPGEVKASFLLKRRQGTLAAFEDALKNDHGPRVVSACPLIKRARLSFIADEPELTRCVPYDAHLDLWFDTLADYDAAYAYKDVIGGILEEIVDLGASGSVLMEEFPMRQDGIDQIVRRGHPVFA